MHSSTSTSTCTHSFPGLPATSSSCEVATLGAVHTFTVRGYALARALGPGEPALSVPFTTAGIHFQLEVYPGGCTPDVSSHVSVFLTCSGSSSTGDDSNTLSKECVLLTELAIIDQVRIKTVKSCLCYCMCVTTYLVMHGCCSTARHN
jgi:hypothetical protein